MVRENKYTKGIKRFELRLKNDQQDALSLIDRKVVSILWGKAGTGKTLVAVFAALKMLGSNEVEKILITRPTVSDEDIGFLPGDLKEKMDPWIVPIIENMKVIIGKENTEYLISQEIVQIKPVSFMRGHTFVDAAVIVDEAQNVTHKQMEMIVGRLGRRSKMMVCGDLRQKDLKGNKRSGFPFLLNKTKDIYQVGNMELLTNHRHDVVEALLGLYEKEV